MFKKLKPCPFCGGIGQLYEPDYPPEIGPRYAVVCTGCGMRTHTIFQQKARALRVWNTRYVQEGDKPKC